MGDAKATPPSHASERMQRLQLICTACSRKLLQSMVRPSIFSCLLLFLLCYGLLSPSGLTALRHCLNPSIPIPIDLTPCYYFAISFFLFLLLVGPLEPTIYKPLYFAIFPSAWPQLSNTIHRCTWLISLVEVKLFDLSSRHKNHPRTWTPLLCLV